MALHGCYFMDFRAQGHREPAHHDPYLARNFAPVRMNEGKPKWLARVVREDCDHLTGDGDPWEHA